MKIKVLIIEDKITDYNFIEAGLKLAKTKSFELCKINLPDLINGIKQNDGISKIPNDIDLFIIDVSLEKGPDELGLRFLIELKLKYQRPFKYIVASLWDKSEYESDIEIDDKIFINKQNYQGFELKLKIRNTINNLDLGESIFNLK